MHIEEGCLIGARLASASELHDESTDYAKAYVYCIEDHDTTPTTEYQNYKFIQTEELTREGIAVHPWGCIVAPVISGDSVRSSVRGDTKIEPPEPTPTPIETPTGDELIVVEYNGKQYGITLGIIMESMIGGTIDFELLEDDNEGGGGGAAI